MATRTLFPPGPWRLRGRALLQLHGVALDRARALVPPELQVIPIGKGRTLGAVYCASYGRGSTLLYNELIVVPALVRQSHRIGGWISHIYVDSPQSLAGGHDIWSLPKQMADFRYGPDRVTVSHGGRVLCSLPQNRRAGWVPVPLFAPVISRDRERALWFHGTGSAWLANGGGDIEIPAGSPIQALGLMRGRGFHLDRMNLLMYPPRPIAGYS